MKSIQHLFFIALALLIFDSSCKKSNHIPTSILGKWNIKMDSLYVGVGPNNHEVSYIGQSRDYFDFSSDGHLYVMENSISDTLKYTLTQGVVLVQSFGSGEGKGEFPSPSAKDLIITSAYLYTPGRIFGRTVYLTR